MKSFFGTPKRIIYLLSHALSAVIGLLICASYPDHPLAYGIGASLVAAGIAGWTVFAHLIASERFNKQVDIVSEFGIVDVFDGRSIRIRSEYIDRLDSARQNIDIMGFGLKAFREDFRTKLSEWKKHAKIRILLIDPEFPSSERSYTIQRDVEEDCDEGSINADVMSFVRTFGSDASSSGKLQIRLYRCLPSVNIFRIDDELFWGPYLMKQPSRNTPTFLVQRRGILYEKLMTHFESIWDSGELSRSFPAEWLENE